MPKPTKGARLGGSASHQKAILANLATSLFEHGRITTTESKAKRLRPYAEKLITHAKAGSLADRRQVLKFIRDKDIVHVLFAEIGPSFAERPGGYTRIIKTLPRKGDNAPMAVIELVRESTVTTEANRANRVAASKKSDKAADEKPAKAAEAKADDAAEAKAVDAEAKADAKPAKAAKAKADEKPAKAAEAKPAKAAEAKADKAADSAELPAGAHAPLDDGSQPEGFPIKGNASSKLYHRPGTRFYESTEAEIWFATDADAEAAGYQLPPSQRDES